MVTIIEPLFRLAFGLDDRSHGLFGGGADPGRARMLSGTSSTGKLLVFGSPTSARSRLYAPNSHITCEARSPRKIDSLARCSNWARAWRSTVFETMELGSSRSGMRSKA